MPPQSCRRTIGRRAADVEAAAGRPLVLGPGGGRTIELGNFAMSLKADTPETGGLFTLLEATEPANFGPPMHIHTNCGEAFYVLEGEYRIFIEDEEHRCPTGSFVFVPQGMRHGFRVGEQPSRKLNIYLPGAMVGYFDALSEAIAEGAADDERLAKIADDAGMHVVGPVPEGYL
jgi:mannose-6-phosphate isomerase-like protein (cupin superfamily)